MEFFPLKHYQRGPSLFLWLLTDAIEKGVKRIPGKSRLLESLFGRVTMEARNLSLSSTWLHRSAKGAAENIF